MRQAAKYPKPLFTIPRLSQSPKYLLPVFNDMRSNTVTVIGFSGGANSELFSYRAKTHRKAAEKLSEAVTALITFYGEGLADMIFDRFPFLFPKVIADRKASGQPFKQAIEVQQALLEQIVGLSGLDQNDPRLNKKLEIAWASYSREYRAELWGNTPPQLRSDLIEVFRPNCPGLITKYNTWEDIQQALGDLFGLTLTGQDYSRFADYVIHRIQSKYINLELDPTIAPEEITKPAYRGVHLNVRTNPQEHSPEIHITTQEFLLMKDIVGPGIHNLYTSQRRTKLLAFVNDKSKVERLLGGMEDLLFYRTPSGVRYGYLLPLKECFDQYLGLLFDRGLYIPD
jgi:hypothetical protein